MNDFIVEYNVRNRFGGTTMKKWRGRLTTIIGIVLILVAIGLFAKPHIDKYFAAKENDEKIEQYMKKHDVDTKTEQSNGKKEDTTSKQKNKKAPEIPKDKSKLVGYIEIPSVKIREAVYPGPATPQQLERGVALAEEEESLSDQNIALAGHTNYDNGIQFTDLHKTKVGDEIKFYLGDEKRTYKIKSFRNVKPEEVQVLDEQEGKKDQLTLITCDNYNPQTGLWEDRSIYVAERVS